MTVSLIVGAVRMAAETTSSPAQILGALNRRLYGRLQDRHLYSPAPRPQRHLLRVKRWASRALPQLSGARHSGCGPLGLFADAAYEEIILFLNLGDYVALYTDGLLEARNTAGEL